MKEYQDIIDKFSLKGYEMYAKTTNAEQWGDKEIGSAYLEKYWLTLDEFEIKWKPIMKNIFNYQTVGLPDKIFKPQFNLMAFSGGAAFIKEEYLLLQECMLEIGDKEFVVVENSYGDNNNWPFFRLKFSVLTKWEDLIAGNFVSSTWIDSIRKEFFICGDSGGWGKYCATDYDYPIDIIGVTSRNLMNFTQRFIQSQEEWAEVYNILPKDYQDKIIRPNS